jgi:hypothetical protein
MSEIQPGYRGPIDELGVVQRFDMAHEGEKESVLSARASAQGIQERFGKSGACKNIHRRSDRKRYSCNVCENRDVSKAGQVLRMEWSLSGHLVVTLQWV